MDEQHNFTKKSLDRLIQFLPVLHDLGSYQIYEPMIDEIPGCCVSSHWSHAIAGCRPP
jgi:hypothetical protein